MIKLQLWDLEAPPYACQRTTTLIRHIMENISYNLFNYVDDFMGIEATFRKANSGFTTLGHLLRDLGVGESMDKSVEPTQIIEFLGVLFNLLTLTISVTPEKMQEISQLLENWQHKQTYTRKELETILGKLQFISNCVRPGRVLVLRLRNALRDTPICGRHDVSEDMRKDIAWWRFFLPVYNNVSIMWLKQELQPDAQLATDASLQAMGAICGKQYVAVKFPASIRQLNYTIVHLEMLAILVSLRLWATSLKGKRFVLNCDNMACVEIIKNGITREANLQNLLRHIAMQCVVNNLEIIPRYIRSVDNRIPDFLSRLHLGPSYARKLRQELPLGCQKIAVPLDFFDVKDIW